MAVEFSEYRGKRKKPFHRHRFPLLRLLFIAILVVLAQVFGLFHKVVDALPLAVDKAPEQVLSWSDLCDSAGGTFSSLKKDLVQCSWYLGDTAITLPNMLLRYVASMPEPGAANLHWVSTRDDFKNGLLVKLEGDSNRNYMFVEKNDTLKFWINETNGCRFPGLCPQLPLGLKLLPITVNFDFAGQESLLAKDVLIGVGDAPVFPVLPGIVLDAGRDSLGYYVELNHGDNVTTRMSGLGHWDTYLKVGDSVSVNVPVGYLETKDSALVFLTVRRNGLFVRWNEFYNATHPVDSASIAIFKKKNGL